MRSTFARICAMKTADDIAGEVRARLHDLVVSAERSTGSRMTAYQTVARRIGTSASFVRKVIGRQQVSLLAHVTDNIRAAHAAYEAACASVERAAAAQRDEYFAQAEEDWHRAAIQGSREPRVLVRREQGAPLQPLVPSADLYGWHP
jgi:hypothetical protein